MMACEEGVQLHWGEISAPLALVTRVTGKTWNLDEVS